MAQVKIFALQSTLASKRAAISEAVHRSLVTHFKLPEDKKFHRFFGLAPEDFVFPADRSEAYVILELSFFEGRSVETKKALIRGLFQELEARAGITAQDVEITFFETPKTSWGIRGKPGDELSLNYRVEV